MLPKDIFAENFMKIDGEMETEDLNNKKQSKNKMFPHFVWGT